MIAPREAAKRDEESWLNEALAHLAEEMHGHGWSNLDYRVSAFLNDPGRYALVGDPNFIGDVRLRGRRVQCVVSRSLRRRC